MAVYERPDERCTDPDSSTDDYARSNGNARAEVNWSCRIVFAN